MAGSAALPAARSPRDSLLPEASHQVGPLAVAARCLPADPRDVMGGDWYGAFALPRGQIGIVIGDVAGHGIGVAPAMIQLRHATRTLAADGLGPGDVLCHLSSTVSRAARGADPLFATVVYAQLDLAAGVLRWASAGHPPPMILTRASLAVPATVTLLPESGDPPAGIIRGHRYGEHTAVFGPGDTLIGYTDGLIERRGRDLDDGVLSVASGLPLLPPAITADPEALADAVLALAPLGCHHDDTTVIVAARQ